MNETVTQVATAMQWVLGEVAERLGRESGFIQRQRALSGAAFVQTLVFGWLSSPAASLQELTGAAANLEVAISRQGLATRFNPTSADFLRRVLETAIGQVIAAQKVETPYLKTFSGVYLLDSTVIELPPILAEYWAGATGAALKISVCWNLQSGALVEVQLQAGCCHDQRSRVQHSPLPLGALRVADLGYFDLEVLQHLDEDGCY